MAWICDNRIKNGIFSATRPLYVRRSFIVKRGAVGALLTCTAMGIYSAQLNGQRIGNYFLTPGFTSYKKHLQCQSYDVTSLLKEGENLLEFNVSGGWAVGQYGLRRRKGIYFDRPALNFRLDINYSGGNVQSIVSDGSCLAGKGKYISASIYNGEIYDASAALRNLRPAAEVVLPFCPEICNTTVPVTERERLSPVSIKKSRRGDIYDFGENIAGVICATFTAKRGQKIVFRHAEILKDGELCTKTLRTAKARCIYIAEEGRNNYIPLHTYMGFRYVEVRGIKPEDINLTALVLCSDIGSSGGFSCSDELLNKLQGCIVRGGLGNFVDIPTDCPQRDERMGWTADTAVFARTACFNFDMKEFYRKWLLSMRDDQGQNGQIPDVVPRADMQNNRSAPVWADACTIVPWVTYLASGDKSILSEHYPCIKAYIADGLTHLTDYVWDKGFQYGDWCAPGVGIKEWRRRGKYVGTCYFANSVQIAAKMAAILGKTEDEKYYSLLFKNICDGYVRRFVNEDGTIKDEFQSAYVLPLYFGMAGQYRQRFANRLAQLVKDNNYHLSTGFAGTPYILFALADNGYEDVAYRVLMQDTCPSWLYEVKAGATTMWERWDALRPDGSVYNASMTSFNHYAYGSVGDFLYRRVAGIEAEEAGYARSVIKPVVGGGLTGASAYTLTPHGKISSSWRIADGTFTLEATVPQGTTCRIIMPSGIVKEVGGGHYKFAEKFKV